LILAPGERARAYLFKRSRRWAVFLQESLCEAKRLGSMYFLPIFFLTFSKKVFFCLSLSDKFRYYLSVVKHTWGWLVLSE